MGLQLLGQHKLLVGYLPGVLGSEKVVYFIENNDNKLFSEYIKKNLHKITEYYMRYGLVFIYRDEMARATSTKQLEKAIRKHLSGIDIHGNQYKKIFQTCDLTIKALEECMDLSPNNPHAISINFEDSEYSYDQTLKRIAREFGTIVNEPTHEEMRNLSHWLESFIIENNITSEQIKKIFISALTITHTIPLVISYDKTERTFIIKLKDSGEAFDLTYSQQVLYLLLLHYKDQVPGISCKDLQHTYKHDLYTAYEKTKGADDGDPLITVENYSNPKRLTEYKTDINDIIKEHFSDNKYLYTPYLINRNGKYFCIDLESSLVEWECHPFELNDK